MNETVSHEAQPGFSDSAVGEPTQIFRALDLSRPDLRALGRSLRKRAPRKSHGAWRPEPSRPDPVAVLRQQESGRVKELLPIRYGRMLESPFRFYRGAAAIMAEDLANTPNIGVHVQACGDAHTLNFGVYASPERQLVFDINDFDETLPAPWEFDLKRLATGARLEALDLGLGADLADEAVRSAVQRYCEVLDQLSRLGTLEIHYALVEEREFLAHADPTVAKFTKRLLRKARNRTNSQFFEKYVTRVDGSPRFVDEPPVWNRLPDHEVDLLHSLFNDYRSTLQSDRRHVLEEFRFRDAALKVVGVGSVGLRAYVLLLEGHGGKPLVIQIKQATTSVLAPHVGPSEYSRDAQRVVVGQRIMQGASDPFLGWVRSGPGDYYVRQARDNKGPSDMIPSPEVHLVSLAVTGGTLARAHARSVDPALLRGYLGSKPEGFVDALVSFARAYADQTEKDYERLVSAVRRGEIEAQRGV